MVRPSPYTPCWRAYPNITNISPNIGVPNSNVPVTITGIFTNWSSQRPGTTVTIGTPAQGIVVTPTNISATTINANVSIPNGFTPAAVNVVVATGPQMLTATNGFTVQATTTTPPTVTFVSPAPSATGIPTNTNITVEFSEPLNPATVSATGANAFITDYTACGNCTPYQSAGLPAMVSLDVSGRILTITPTTSLGVGRMFYIQLNSPNIPGGTQKLTDQSGNLLAASNYSFTTGFTPSSVGPAFVTSNIPSGATGVPTNTLNVTLGFSQPIDPATQPAGLSITTGAVPVAVPGVWSYNTAFTQAIFTPTSGFAASTAYTVNYGAQLQNLAGAALTNPNSFTFTTGTGADTLTGAYLTWTPAPTRSPNPIAVGTNPTIRFVYNKPLNPLTVTPSNFYVYDVDNSVTVLGSTVSYSADFKTFTLNLNGTLQPATNYRWYLSGELNWEGGGETTGSVYFTTGPVPDTTTPAVLFVAPAATVSCESASPRAPR